MVMPVITPTDCLLVDFKCIVIKIYSFFFYINSVCVETLKEFCNAADTEYKKLGYSKTRWLALNTGKSFENVSAI
jgi:hypothetical protein